MPEQIRDSYLGLPVITENECALVIDLLENGDPEQQETLDYIADGVLDVRPLIGDLINADIVFSRDEEADKNVSKAQVGEYIMGIREGYEFVIGVFTYVWMLRRGSASVSDYTSQQTKNDQELPLRKMSQYRQARRCRQGEGLTNCEIEDDTNSSDLSEQDTVRYIYLCRFFDELVDKHDEQLWQMSSGEDSDEFAAFIQGVERGRQDAIEMYIQSYQQAYLSWLKRRLGFKSFREYAREQSS